MLANHIPAIASPTATFPPRRGNEIIPWIDGHPFYSRLFEAFQRAQHSIWFVVSFIHRDFCFPQGPLLWDVLREAHARGIDVRVLFWHNPQFMNTSHLFLGDEADRQLLAEHGAQWHARWASSGPHAPNHCHHHKFWLIDAGQSTETGFAGGMTWGKSTLDTPQHLALPHSRHDICVELTGPCVRDIAEIFVAHWNHAGLDPHAPPPWPLPNDRAPMHIPGQRTAPQDKGCVAQVTRTLRPGDAGPSEGENSIFYQYQAAIAAARRSIYIENQHPGEAALLEALEAAVQRGVQVVMVVPGVPMQAIFEERQRTTAYQRDPTLPEPRYFRAFAALERLQKHPLFSMVALATSASPRQAYKEIYVHAKICIVDAVWVTCGSANLVDLSFHNDHTELNLSWWHPKSASHMLRSLLAEHTDAPLRADQPNERIWLQIMAATACANSIRRQRQQPMQGHAYTIDASLYPFAQ